jgi:hypothetical protein
MTMPICQHCGQHLNDLEEHDQEKCAIEKRREIYRRGAAAARAALHAARKDTS